MDDLGRIFSQPPLGAGSVRGMIGRPQGQIGRPGPASPGLSRLRPTTPAAPPPLGDFIPGAVVVVIDEADYFTPLAQLIWLSAWNPVVFKSDDDFAPTAATAKGDDDCYLANQVQQLPWQRRVFNDEGDVSAILYLEQEEPLVPRCEIIVWNAVRFIEPEEVAILFIDQEDYWTAKVTTTPWTPVTFIDQEELLMLWLDQEEHWTAQVTAIAWTPVAFRDQDELPIFYLEQEEPWIAQYQSQPWKAVAFTDDELYPMLFIDQEDHWTPQVISSIWTPVVFMDRDELPMLLIDQQDQWLAIEQRIQWTPIVFASDDVLASPAVVVEEETRPPATVMPLAWQAVLFASDEAGLITGLDDDAYSIPAPWKALAASQTIVGEEPQFHIALEESEAPGLARGISWQSPDAAAMMFRVWVSDTWAINTTLAKVFPVLYASAAFTQVVISGPTGAELYEGPDFETVICQPGRIDLIKGPDFPEL